MKLTQEQSITLARAYRAGYEAGRESMKVDSIHTCHNQCQRPTCVAVREAYAAGRKDENEACAELCADVGKEYNNEINKKLGLGYELQEVAFDCAAAIRARREQ